MRIARLTRPAVAFAAAAGAQRREAGVAPDQSYRSSEKEQFAEASKIYTRRKRKETPERAHFKVMIFFKRKAVSKLRSRKNADVAFRDVTKGSGGKLRLGIHRESSLLSAIGATSRIGVAATLKTAKPQDGSYAAPITWPSSKRRRAVNNEESSEFRLPLKLSTLAHCSELLRQAWRTVARWQNFRRGRKKQYFSRRKYKCRLG